eukprot:TRINITY_DN5882_c0_g1_i2.p1 TRINITY_DN5882_c0_g1~~TRINITY_DN5882_c0_g1_i2.p1  ORF type:complete len:1292 (+),score=233.67 TRINITY_DN5882_c0_g1_i2:811-4686(+)
MEGHGDGAQPAPVDKYAQYRKQGFEPAMLAAKYMMPVDDEIREADIPERLQLRPSSRRPAPTDEELAEEASWIFDMALSASPEAASMRDAATMKIVNVLRLLLIDHMEIPYIQQYRKDQHEPELKTSHLWDIYDWDQRWVVFRERKTRLRMMFESHSDLMEHAASVDICTKEEDLSDFIDLWQYRARDDRLREQALLEATQEAAGKKKLKRPEQRDLHYIARRTDAAKFVPYYGLSLADLSSNVSSNYLVVEPTNEPRFPDQVAEDFVCSEYKRSDDVIRAARNIFAYDISSAHVIRSALRVVYNNHVAISTDPTPEGLREIDAFHRFRFVKRLRQKPLHRFIEGDFLLLLQAVQQGRITMRVELTSNCEQKMQNQLENMFLSPSSNEYAEKWNEERKKVVSLALSKFLLPTFERQILAKARQEAEQYIARACTRALEALLLKGPYEPPQLQIFDQDKPHSRTHVTVMGVSVADDATGLVMLDSHGDVKESLTLNAGIRSTQDVQLAVDFILQHAPSVIAIGADSMRAGDVLQSIIKILDKIKTDCLATDTVNPCKDTRPTFADASAARIFENSSRSAELHKELSPLLRKAVSIGRRLLDPLLELAGLWGPNEELLHLPLHPLQGLVEKSLLKRQYERCFLNVVNAVGVDINRIARHKWMHPVLQFVCGLGPRKAEALLTSMRRVGNRIDSRNDLKARRWMGECVFKNAAGFLYVKPHSLRDLDEMDDYDSAGGKVLDQTRIHPDDYMYAEKVAQDAFPDDEDDVDPVERLMSDPQRLENLDFSYFASKLPEGKSHTLDLIKNEFHNPGIDIRALYQDPSCPEIFTMLTGETRDSLRPGTLLNVTVIRPGPVTRVKLDCGLEGEIAVEDLTDGYDGKMRAGDIVTSNSVIPARVLALNIDNMPFTCKLTSKRSQLVDVQSFVPRANPDTTYLLESEDDLKGFIAEEQAQREQTDRENVAKHNMATLRIAHPLFHPWTYQEAKDHLADKDPGTCVVRPSSKTLNAVKILLKLLPDVYVDLEAIYVPENQRESRSDPQFMVKDSKFMDLNDLIVHFVDKIAMYADDLARHRKFRDLPREEIEHLVVSASEAGRKEYYVRASNSVPGLFELVCCPSKRARRIPITIAAEGMKAFGKTFQDPDRLFDYFKRHTKEIIEKLNVDEAERQRKKEAQAYSAPHMSSDTPWGASNTNGNWNNPSAAPQYDSATLVAWGSSAPASESWGAASQANNGWAASSSTNDSNSGAWGASAPANTASGAWGVSGGASASWDASNSNPPAQTSAAASWGQPNESNW